MLSLKCRAGSTGPLMGTRRGGGKGGGTSLGSMPRIAMGFDAAEGDRLSEKGIPRLGAPKGRGRGSPRPVDIDGRGLVLMSLAPYPREGAAWMGMAAMSSVCECGRECVACAGGVVRRRRRAWRRQWTAGERGRREGREGMAMAMSAAGGPVCWLGEEWRARERAEVQGDRRLATAAAYEVIAEPRPSQEADTKGGSATGNRPRWSRIATRGRLSCWVRRQDPVVPAVGARDWFESRTIQRTPRMNQDGESKRRQEREGAGSK